ECRAGRGQTPLARHAGTGYVPTDDAMVCVRSRLGHIARATHPGPHLRNGGLGEAVPDGGYAARASILRRSVRRDLDPDVASLDLGTRDPLYRVRGRVASVRGVLSAAGALRLGSHPRDRHVRTPLEGFSVRVPYPRDPEARSGALPARHAARRRRGVLGLPDLAALGPRSVSTLRAPLVHR